MVLKGNKDIVYYRRNGKMFWFNRVWRVRRVEKEFMRDCTPGIGRVIKQNGYRIDRNKNEYKTAYWIKDNFGGDIICINEELNRKDSESKPDYIWKGKWWDLKNLNGASGLSKRLKIAIYQINSNTEREPGGVILDITNAGISDKDAIAIVKRRLSESAKTKMHVIIKRKLKVVAIIKAEKKQT
ncbi:MAG: hypothetical protein Q4D13_03625 [Erysipelotrichaceae bacterium]|nr:hypothetical protein [Erysipelotrichaceae bacterium]